MDHSHEGHPPGSERYDTHQRSVSITSTTSSHSSHSSHATTPNARSPVSSTLGASPHTPYTPQLLFQRSPAPEPSSNLVRNRAPHEPLSQSPLHSRGMHDPTATSFLCDPSPAASQLAESGSSNSHELDHPPFSLEPAAKIRDRALENTNRSRALSASSSVDPAGSFAPSMSHQLILRPSIQMNETGVHQPSQGIRPRTVSFGAAPHHDAAAAYQLSQSPLLNDVVLMTAISAANAEHREFPWYCVWTRALEKHTFPSTIGEYLVCNLAPQHVLIRSFDPSPPDSLPLVMAHEADFGGGLGPQTPPRHTQSRIKQYAVPDFAQILRRIHLPPSIPPIIKREKVIFLAEIKPKKFQNTINCNFSSVNSQISRQATHAFSADPTLMIISAIIAFGSFWKYVEIPRPPGDIQSNWSEFEDPTFGSQPNTRLKLKVPTVLRRLSDNPNKSFDLMDPQGKSAEALKVIADRIIEREKNF